MLLCNMGKFVNLKDYVDENILASCCCCCCCCWWFEATLQHQNVDLLCLFLNSYLLPAYLLLLSR